MTPTAIELTTAHKDISVSVYLDFMPMKVLEVGREKVMTVTLYASLHRPTKATHEDGCINTKVLYIDNGSNVHPCVELVNQALADYASFCKGLSRTEGLMTSRREHCTVLRSLLLKQVAVHTDQVARFLATDAIWKPAEEEAATAEKQEEENLLD